MSWGRIDQKQEQEIKKHIQRQKVFDLGAGDHALAMALCVMGAREVVAIESSQHDRKFLDARVRSVTATFDKWARENPHMPIDVAFVSWPDNHYDLGLMTLVKRATTVIYLGKNTDGRCCGSPALFKHFLTRRLDAYVPNEDNTLCVYGSVLDTPRQGQYEERAGIDMRKIMTYSEVIA